MQLQGEQGQGVHRSRRHTSRTISPHLVHSNGCHARTFFFRVPQQSLVLGLACPYYLLLTGPAWWQLEASFCGRDARGPRASAPASNASAPTSDSHEMWRKCVSAGVDGGVACGEAAGESECGSDGGRGGGGETAGDELDEPEAYHFSMLDLQRIGETFCRQTPPCQQSISPLSTILPDNPAPAAVTPHDVPYPPVLHPHPYRGQCHPRPLFTAPPSIHTASYPHHTSTCSPPPTSSHPSNIDAPMATDVPHPPTQPALPPFLLSTPPLPSPPRPT